jgi:hypothetical protein
MLKNAATFVASQPQTDLDTGNTRRVLRCSVTPSARPPDA